jgi:putative cardiolipin synthase
MSLLTRTLLPLLVLGITGCASIDFDYPRVESTYLPDTGDTYLAEKMQLAAAGRPQDSSGFFFLLDGIDALAARLRLAETAERSIDVQYYLIKQDIVGHVFMGTLLRAADRGVRVRLLLDDMFTQGFDSALLALDSHPNFEIRIYNPFHRGVLGRNVGAVANFRRINRRMHNKSFTLDNQVTIIGGRNIADEYFGAREDAAFGDLDVIGIGPIVQEVSTMFDTYWRHETALPVAAFMKPLKDPQAQLDQLRGAVHEYAEQIKDTPYAQAVINKAFVEIEQDPDSFRWAPYKFIYDTPDKGIKGRAGEVDLITAALGESLSAVKQELTIISPYFVPEKAWRKGLAAAEEAGIKITVVTNSLAANNQKMVHGGYAPSRKPLLKAGVSIYEVRPDVHIPGVEYVDSDDARATLHTKAYIVDRSEIFVGSFNFDPRSAYLNTEMGVLIDEPTMGAEFAQGLKESLLMDSWQVSLDERNNLRWSGVDDGEPVEYDKEPMTSWWQRFVAGFYRILPIRSQL